ncbi:MAG: 3-hydroxyacyl-ACP dehydratase FabZ [Thermaerobacter sp.]|nr:3-hydroxyacyl-ACP dehydratase FabZ [Thermaerobacter sp.]
MNLQEIMDIIPHRYPFLLVDRILELEPGRRAVGLKNVSVNEPYFQGHFPGHPIMPGVLVLEAMAQVGALMILSTEEHRGKLGLFGGADRVRFRRQVLPGDQLRIEVDLIRMRGDLGKGAAKAFVGERLVAQAELTFAVTAP